MSIKNFKNSNKVTDNGSDVFLQQVASRALGVDINKIHLSETSTATVPNTSSTAASVGSDLNGMAVLVSLWILFTTRQYQ